MKNEVEEAKKQKERTINTKKDTFLVLCSLNLLNAAVKKDEYKGMVGYGLIKPSVSKFIEFCMENSCSDFVDEICYNPKERCVYIRCYGLQFSFHNISTKYIQTDFLNILSNRPTKWDGIKLQPLALNLYKLAVSCFENNISEEDVIKEKIQNIICCSKKNASLETIEE